MIRSPLPRLARQALLVALAAVSAAVVAACAGEQPSSTPPKWDARSVAESIKGAPFTPVVLNSNIGREPTRLTIALFKPDQTLVLDAGITARIYRIANDPEKEPAAGTLLDLFELTPRTIDTAEHDQGRTARPDRDDRAHTMLEVALRDTGRDAASAPLPAHDGTVSTVFTAMVEFNEPGLWGAQLQVKTGNKTYRDLLVTFSVLEKTAEPSIGADAPLTKQKIAKDVADLAEIDSSTKPLPGLHNITVADAVASGKPSLVAFVTPAFCQTRFCGPVLQNVVVPAHQQYGDRVHVIHIEPYDLSAARRGTLSAVPAAREWNLRSEPFIAIVGSDGRIAAKFEGIIDLAEVKQALDVALGGR